MLLAGLISNTQKTIDIIHQSLINEMNRTIGVLKSFFLLKLIQKNELVETVLFLDKCNGN